MNTSAETHTPAAGSQRGLPPATRRHLVIGCVASIVLCIIAWNAFAVRQSARIPLTQQFANQPEHQIVAALKAIGIESAQVDDGCLVVSAGDEARCRQFLQESNTDHATWADEWQRANELLTPFSSASERSAAREIARARRISQMLSGMPGIQYADVVWDEQTGRGFRHESTVRATVYIRPSTDGQLTSKMVESIREAVAGSKANLAADDVIVMDLSTGMTHRVQAALNALPSTDASEQPLAEDADHEQIVSAEIEPDSIDRSEMTNRRPQSLENSSDVDVSFASMPSSSMTPVAQERPGETSQSPLFDDPLYTSPFTSYSTVPSVASSITQRESPVNVPAQPTTVSTSEMIHQADWAAPWIVEASEFDGEIIEPERERTSTSVPLAARREAANNIISRSDMRFFVWVGIGVITLVAVMRGVGGASAMRPPDLNLTSQMPVSAGLDQKESPASPYPSLVATGTTSVKTDSLSSSSRELFETRDEQSASGHLAPEVDTDALPAFEHLGWLDADTIQKLYRCLPDEPWALALSGASTQIQENVLNSLSRSSSIMLQRRMNSLPAIRLRDVEDAQRRLAEWIRKLDEMADIG